MSQPVSIVWFRQDLRVIDNPALFAAVEHGTIVPVYIFDSEIAEEEQPGGASNWWLHHSLESLNKRLNGHLQCFSGDPQTILCDLVSKFSANAVFWNRCYEPTVIERDKKIKQALRDSGCLVSSFNGSLLWEPMSIRKQDGGVYRVFTPYYRKGCLQASAPRYPSPAPTRITYADVSREGHTIQDAGLLPDIDWDSAFYDHWKPGEEGAADKLSDFIRHAARGYQEERNIPSVRGTSRLSPHLHFGEISPNQAWYALLNAFDDQGNSDLDCFLSELGWREFSYYLLFHFPTITEQNFNYQFDKFKWLNRQDDFIAWSKGQTGIPIVDAGMRELWQTGYMHNRVRMIVGSFLVKNLLIDWRKGERWFWDCLVDADRASNAASWQWVAGSGADAAPYFRIFNPVLQGEKFDKQGAYVKTYCPELKHIPDKYLHKPWEAPKEVLNKAGITLGKDYPKPIADLKQTRQRALDAYADTKEN
ncbi:cryptochrome/photolyase family protein [Alteromonas lipolytica]|uniref:Deoxyribodipyrimidine photo-lyase n=1 Tax=Alteromonas lipolytica TaxID=1856405 RepID=A0A1E8FHS7_9ALTE|nr:deoxyribodipyrimidine photo-lyase [Alteromonas lipolytica]OFI35168.1 deoxyribodipyrimidine photolyase [Alteromonas lipolytica]GGF57293.1 deoxyribodipyrimidine photo-lyase [Alteromonas lipolytica]